MGKVRAGAQSYLHWCKLESCHGITYYIWLHPVGWSPVRIHGTRRAGRMPRNPVSASGSGPLSQWPQCRVVGTFHCTDCSYGAIICLPDPKSREMDTECGGPILVGSVGHWQKLSVIVSEGVRVTQRWSGCSNETCCFFFHEKIKVFNFNFCFKGDCSWLGWVPVTLHKVISDS